MGDKERWDVESQTVVNLLAGWSPLASPRQGCIYQHVTDRWQHNTHALLSQCRAMIQIVEKLSAAKRQKTWVSWHLVCKLVIALKAEQWKRGNGCIQVVEWCPNTILKVYFPKLIIIASFHLLSWQPKWQFSESFTTKIVPHVSSLQSFPILPQQT